MNKFSTCREPLDQIKNEFGGFIYRSQNKHLGYKIVWVLRISTRQAEGFLKAIACYSIIKRKQIRYALISRYLTSLHQTKWQGKNNSRPIELSELQFKIKTKMMNEIMGNGNNGE